MEVLQSVLQTWLNREAYLYMCSEVKVPFGRITCLWLDCSQSLIFEIVINREIVNEFNWPPFWSVYASETGESYVWMYEYKLPLGTGGGVDSVEEKVPRPPPPLTHGHFVLSPVLPDLFSCKSCNCIRQSLCKNKIN